MGSDQRGTAPKLSRDERLRPVERDNPDLPLKTKAEVLELNRSGLYYQSVALSQEEIAIKHLTDETHTARPYYGSRRIGAGGPSKERSISMSTVERYVCEMRTMATCPGRGLNKRAGEHKIHPYLPRNPFASLRASFDHRSSRSGLGPMSRTFACAEVTRTR